MTAIEICNLTKRFASVLAVDNLTFNVSPGTVTGFLGPNGAGKTTTLRMLLGLIEPTQGTTTFGGQPYIELADPVRHVGAVLEASSFYPGRSARNHLRVQAATSGIDAARIDAVLELVGLTNAADRRVGGFSLGMNQRLGLANALLGDPEVLILDEPANGLDPEGVHWLRELIRGFADEGRTVLVSSHLLAEVAQTVDSVVILDRGHMITQAPLDQLTQTSGAQPVIRIRTPEVEKLRAVVAGDGAQAQATGPDTLEVTASTPERIGTLAARCSIPIFESVTQDADLETIFLELTGTGPDTKDTPQ